MTVHLLHGDALHVPELRHEIGEPIGDPVTFIDDGGRRIAVCSTLDASTLARRDDLLDEVWTDDELGYRELARDESVDVHDIGPELVLRALRRAGAASVTVPGSFGILVADHLRRNGIEVVVDAAGWAARRRRKTPAELEGIERAQRAADTAMLTAARMIRAAEPIDDERLRFEGEVLTAELIREAMAAELLAQGSESEEILVQPGDQCLDGHGLGSGPIPPDAPCIIDCFPRDRRSSAHTDMTRTFVAGRPSEELSRMHAACREALDIAFENLRPGESGAYAKVADHFEALGFPTSRSHDGPETLRAGFNHALGHGVGLEVHERPWMGRRPDELVEGDVVAVEPGLYFEGIGGVRLEDTVLVTADGVEHFTDPLPYDLGP